MPTDPFERLALFRDMTPAQLARLRAMFNACDCYGDTALFDQGDPATFLYVVISGQVTIRYKPDDGSEITVAHVKPGGVVGWSAILGNRSYTSGAYCVGYTQMLRGSGQDLRDLCKEQPETGILVLERLAEIVAERLHHTQEQVIALLKEGMRNEMSSYKEV
jgi:CRP-like cAMP-binding protein